jgi:hypothetical protein
MLLSVGFLGSEGGVSAQDSTDDPVFVGAGDIASCDVARTGDDARAKLLSEIVDPATSPTTVFTTGDNAGLRVPRCSATVHRAECGVHLFYRTTAEINFSLNWM